MLCQCFLNGIGTIPVINHKLLILPPTTILCTWDKKSQLSKLY